MTEPALPALTGIRVLDLSRVLAGPFCGQMLADNGAEVIKVEAPGGDMNRAFPQVLAPGESTNFTSVNRGKLDITLNLKHPRARRIVHDLVAKVDVVIQSFLPDTAQKLAVDYDTLRNINPNLVYASISGYGSQGALRNKPGYDMMVSAYAGIMSLTGEPDQPPVRVGVTLIDLGTGMLTYSGIVTALHARSKIWAEQGTNAAGGSYKTSDGDILLGAPTEPGWAKLKDMLGNPSSLDDPRFATNVERCANEPALRLALEAELAHHPSAYWLPRIEAAGLPCAPINTIDQVLEDPQVHANDMVVTSYDDQGKAVRLLGLPFKLSGTPGKPGAAPPRVGQHNVEVLREMLGLSEDEVNDLAEDGAI
jgi:crotonobetainyl-CoA:carnitine CoA-transferase CaiB-like acyl-CoA transferase